MEKVNYYEICKQKLKYFNYSPNTSRCYLFYINEFLYITSNIYPSRLSSDNFQHYLNSYEFSSVSQQNQIINAIRFLYKFGLEKKYDKVSFVRPRTEKHLPQIIDKEQLFLLAILMCVFIPKSHTLLKREKMSIIFLILLILR